MWPTPLCTARLRERAALTAQCPLDQKPGRCPAGSGSWVASQDSSFIQDVSCRMSLPDTWQAEALVAPHLAASLLLPSEAVAGAQPSAVMRGRGQQETSAD